MNVIVLRIVYLYYLGRTPSHAAIIILPLFASHEIVGNKSLSFSHTVNPRLSPQSRLSPRTQISPRVALNFEISPPFE